MYVLLNDRRHIRECVRDDEQLLIEARSAKESENGAQQEMQECMVSVSPLQSLNPDEYDKKTPHTAALKRVTELTRQKDAKKKLTRQASGEGEREDIESSPLTSKVLTVAGVLGPSPGSSGVPSIHP